MDDEFEVPTVPFEELIGATSSRVVSIVADQGEGAGFFVMPDGVIATNRHVVGFARKVLVRLANTRELSGQVVRSRRDLDLAFVKVDAQLQALPLRADTSLKVGQPVVASADLAAGALGYCPMCGKSARTVHKSCQNCGALVAPHAATCSWRVRRSASPATKYASSARDPSSGSTAKKLMRSSSACPITQMRSMTASWTSSALASSTGSAARRRHRRPPRS